MNVSKRAYLSKSCLCQRKRAPSFKCYVKYMLKTRSSVYEKFVKISTSNFYRQIGACSHEPIETACTTGLQRAVPNSSSKLTMEFPVSRRVTVFVTYSDPPLTEPMTVCDRTSAVIRAATISQRCTRGGDGVRAPPEAITAATSRHRGTSAGYTPPPRTGGRQTRIHGLTDSLCRGFTVSRVHGGTGRAQSEERWCGRRRAGRVTEGGRPAGAHRPPADLPAEAAAPRARHPLSPDGAQ